jgi:metal-sulfur cluster biosynthetic enzyme
MGTDRWREPELPTDPYKPHPYTYDEASNGRDTEEETYSFAHDGHDKMIDTPPPQQSSVPLPGVPDTNDLSAVARTALHDVIDPELGISIVDLGLIYDVTMHGPTARVTMTTTSPVCPLGGFLSKQVEQRLKKLDGIDTVEVMIVTDPPWSFDLLSPNARKILGYT